MKAPSKLFRCQICDNRFSVVDVEELNFFIDQMICFNCYNQGAKEEHRVWCFGKKSIVSPTGKTQRYGFDPAGSIDCRKICPDRKICRLFATNEIFRARKALKAQLPYPMGSSLQKIFIMCVMGTTKEKLIERVKTEGGDVKGVLKSLKRGKDYKGDAKWKLIERNGKIRIKFL